MMQEQKGLNNAQRCLVAHRTSAEMPGPRRTTPLAAFGPDHANACKLLAGSIDLTEAPQRGLAAVAKCMVGPPLGNPSPSSSLAFVVFH